MASRRLFLTFLSALALASSVARAQDLRTLEGDVFRHDDAVSGYRTDVQSGSLAGNITLTLPPTVGSSGYVIKSDGSGVMAWAAPLSLLSPANVTTNGYLASGDWVTFNAKQPTVSATAPVTFTSNTVAIPKADATHNGYLSSTDWSTFSAAGGSVNEATQKFTLSGTDISNGYVTLAHTPAVAGNVHCFKKNGLSQVYGDDFTMATATHLSWSGLGLSMIASDVLVCSYLY